MGKSDVQIIESETDGDELPVKPTRKRFTTQQIQEEISFHQFCLATLPWSISRPKDHGEDVYVSIFDNEAWIGTSFLGQLKSGKNLKPNTDGEVTRTIPVKDLLHWAKATTPLFIIAWGVVLSCGYYQPLDEALKGLDENNQGWRDRRPSDNRRGTEPKVSVHFPMTNRWNEEGKKTVRALVGLHFYPIVSRGKTETVKVSGDFPDEPEAREIHDQLLRTIEDGVGEVTIPAKYLKEFKRAPWSEQLLGPEIPEFVTLKPGGPRPANFSLRAVGEVDIHSFPLKVTFTAGSERMLFQGDPDDIIQFRYAHEKGVHTLDGLEIGLKGVPLTPRRLLEFQKFMRAYVVKQRATLMFDDSPVCEFSINMPAQTETDIDNNCRLAVQLIEIEDAAGMTDQLRVPFTFDADERPKIEKLAKALRGEVWEFTAPNRFQRDPFPGSENFVFNPEDYTKILKDRSAVVFGVKVPLGTVISSIKDPEATLHAVEAALKAAEDGGADKPQVTVDVTWINRLATEADGATVAKYSGPAVPPSRRGT